MSRSGAILLVMTSGVLAFCLFLSGIKEHFGVPSAGGDQQAGAWWDQETRMTNGVLSFRDRE